MAKRKHKDVVVLTNELERARWNLANCVHEWKQDYIQPYMTPSEDPNYREYFLWKSWKEVLMTGDQPVPGQYRCPNCQAVGRKNASGQILRVR